MSLRLLSITRRLQGHWRFEQVGLQHVRNLAHVSTAKEDCVTPYTCIKDSDALPEGTKLPRVIIIGAGMAGLSAAARLTQCGLTNFIVYEACHRSGGRIHSRQMRDTMLELGVDNIYGDSMTNSVTVLAAEEDLLQEPVHRRMGMPFRNLHTETAEKLPRKTLKKVLDIFEALYKKRHAPSRHASLFEHLERGLFDMEGYKGANSVEQYQMYLAFVGLCGWLRTQFGHDLGRLSVDQWKGWDGIHRAKFKLLGGMNSLMSPLLRQLPQGSIEFCKPVECIRWGAAGSGQARAVVQMADGHNHTCDYVLVTTSLGFLKNNKHCFFCPELPESRSKAIDKLGFCQLNRIFLEYAKPFWNPDTWGVTFIPNLERRLKPGRTKKDWSESVFGFSTIGTSRKMLVFKVAGRAGLEVECAEDSEVNTKLTAIIRRYFGDTSIPLAEKVHRTSWCTDPFFRGAFTFIGVGSTRADIESVSSPMPGEGCLTPTILFAGEHTHPTEFSTLHGARNSGIREADRILDYTRKFKGPPPSYDKPTVPQSS